MLLKRLTSIIFLAQCLPSYTNAGKQLWNISHVGSSSRGLLGLNYAGQWHAPDRILSATTEPSRISWDADVSGIYYGRPDCCFHSSTVLSDQCVERFGDLECGILEVIKSLFSRLSILLLGLVVNVHTLTLLNLPAYHRSRALHVIQGLSDDADFDSQVKAWEQLIRPLIEEWKTVCVLAALMSGATLAMFQISSFNNNSVTPALVYLTLICTMIAILLSSIIAIHLGAETRDSEFIHIWLKRFRSTDHRSLWGAWVIVFVPSVWTVWGALFFISSVVVLFWSESTAAAKTVNSFSLTASNSIVALEPSLHIPLLLTAVVFLGFFNILGVVFSFWKQGRQRSTPLEAA
ncbi:hypothetical protein K443DRAFT_678749 [Laccaria amethystina LaAM-08-1]|uniref:Unplaced genomic scaffold K443scaffold_78, whole genome shotgun sequence n=1 Tax=Laccaria amethystina LaAM-08-1 TaxID=1095629 RepID=A0A0C9WRC0_9AGAR|nr:hypothetical protein K443DRAFT_678749 [Laccaria amethystina LaAM-08-1]